jgi:hypothetical protein
MADMMENIARILSHYQQLCEAENRARHLLSQDHSQRASLLLSYIYAELAQFFLDLLPLFERGASQGTLLFYVQHFGTGCCQLGEAAGPEKATRCGMRA